MRNSVQLYIKRSSPRTLVLAPTSSDSSSKSLVFLQESEQRPHVVVVEYISTDELELGSSKYVRWTGHVAGVLGLVGGGGSQEAGSSPVKETFLVLATGTTSIGSVRPATGTAPPEPVSKLLSVSYHSLTSSTWDADPTLASQDDFESDSAAVRAFQYYDQASQATALFPHPLAGMKKILEAGSFFFADRGSWDLSSRLEERLRRGGQGNAGVSLEETGEQAFDEDKRFVWNQYILEGLRDFRDKLEEEDRDELDDWGVIIPLIQGFVSTATIPLPHLQEMITLAVISRLSSRRAGTRFNSRGVDEDGNTANFVETETIVTVGDLSMSWTQVRGSVPLFWEQQGLQAFGQKLQITRPAKVSQLAFEKHFDELVDIYQRVHNVNLLGTKDQEVILSKAYNDHLQTYNRSKPPPTLVDMTNFDFHRAVKVGGAEKVKGGIRGIAGVRDALEGFGWTLVDAGEGLGRVMEEQVGVFRTNCLDCLDRTNVICEIFSAAVIERFLSTTNPQWLNIPQLWAAHSNIWADNGDLLSKVYAGTGAINTSFTRTGKRTLGGLLSDASKSVGRAYINNFTDAAKQVSIDMLLGMRADQQQIEIHDPLREQYRRMMDERSDEYASVRQISVHCCTWNLNGKSPTENLLPWLLPDKLPSEPDLISVAFQEIVPLNAQQIVQTDPAKRLLWERTITDSLAKRPGKESDYLLLRSEQLVGTALLVYIKDSLAGDVRKVESTTKKTGLRGMSGNKGGVAIRLDLFDTSLCFVTAHLAAGHSNVAERNADFHTIEAGIRFLRGKTLRSHDMVFFSGDFNYRVDLPNEEARALAGAGAVEALLEGDQLIRAMSQGQAFGGYREAEITFLPTYKYDPGTDTYDTSEKARIPAFTDRVVYSGSTVHAESYLRAELRSSDHRPVMAWLLADVQIIDGPTRAMVAKEVKGSLRGTSTPTTGNLSSRLGKMMSTESEADLPPPSSETSHWWTEGGDDLASVVADAAVGGEENPWGDLGDGLQAKEPLGVL